MKGGQFQPNLICYLILSWFFEICSVKDLDECPWIFLIIFVTT